MTKLSGVSKPGLCDGKEVFKFNNQEVQGDISKWISNLKYSIFRALTEQVLVDDVEADEEASYLTDPFLNLAIIDIVFSSLDLHFFPLWIRERCIEKRVKKTNKC